MNSFAFHNPTLVRRFGTGLVVGTSIVLIILALLLTNIARGNYANIAAQQEAIVMSERAANTETGETGQITFYTADTPQLAQAQMQSDMQEIAQQSQVRLEVIRAEQIEQLNGSLRMALTLNGVVPENQLGGFLESIAAHSPVIVVESINMRRARARNQGVDTRPLAIQLKLSGFAGQ